MAAAMVVDACDDEEAGLYMCTTCATKIEEGKSILVNAAGVTRNEADRRRCRKCHNMLCRLQRAVKQLNEEARVGYRAMKPEARREFYKKTRNLCGADLNKELTEAILLSDIERVTKMMANEEGIFQPRDEAVADWSLKRPEMLKALLENARTRTCQHTEREMIMVPSYSVKLSWEQQNKLEQQKEARKIKKMRKLDRAKERRKMRRLDRLQIQRREEDQSEKGN